MFISQNNEIVVLGSFAWAIMVQADVLKSN